MMAKFTLFLIPPVLGKVSIMFTQHTQCLLLSNALTADFFLKLGDRSAVGQYMDEQSNCHYVFKK